MRFAIWISEEKIATCGDDLKIRIFNLHTTQKLFELEAHEDFIRNLAYDSRTHTLVSCSDDKTIKVWNFDENSNVLTEKR